MRVIGGSARGRTLKGPPKPARGRRPLVRPTSDLVRGVIFDMLDAMGADYTRVLDLYAGTGALGIEALSRGGGTADFVESATDAAAVIRANLAATRFEDRARVHQVPVRRSMSRLRGPYSLILADPPYSDDDAVGAIAAIAASPLVDDGTILVIEHHRAAAPPAVIGGLALRKTRRHGDTAVSIYGADQEDAS